MSDPRPITGRMQADNAVYMPYEDEGYFTFEARLAFHASCNDPLARMTLEEEFFGVGKLVQYAQYASRYATLH